LRRRDHAARRAGADHELEGRLQLLAAAFVAQVAVVLLVAAVVLDQGLVGSRNAPVTGSARLCSSGAAQAARCRA
jgi:hypothetical protein